MKKYILSIVALICFSLNAQITSYHLVYVKSEDQAKFEEVEKKYNSNIDIIFYYFICKCCVSWYANN